MNNLQNLHTHTTYCDGADTPEQMVQHAINKGFDSLGFSGHSYMFFSPSWSMSEEGTEKYKQEIRFLQSRYEDKIKLYLGLEVDMFSGIDFSGYDYLIGSCHYFKFGDQYVGFDRSAEICVDIVNEYFGGNGMEFAKEYYRHISQLYKYGKFDIIGHFDLITKNIEKVLFFDPNSKEYFNSAVEALECLRGRIPLFEVNTGAVARGYRTEPYPSVALMKEMKRMGFGAVISSDCHDGNKLDCGFEDARELLVSCGFKERYILTDSGFKAVEI